MSRCDANQEQAMESTSFLVWKQHGRLADLVTLTKPGVMMLAVFTAIIALTIAPGDLGPLRGCIAVLAIAAGAGAAGVLNKWYDADIDTLMTRTARRPLLRPRGSMATSTSLGYWRPMSSSTCRVSSGPVRSSTRCRKRLVADGAGIQRRPAPLSSSRSCFAVIRLAVPKPSVKRL
jgi:hypothetical protein